MKKLSKKQMVESQGLTNGLIEAQSKVEETLGQYQEVVNEAFEKVQGAVEHYNSVLANAGDFRNEIVEEMQSYYDDRSEKWQESDAGQSYTDWKDQWESAVFEPIEIEEPTSLEFEVNESVLSDLPEECD